jgi:Fe-S-cluster containining protein
MKAPEPIRSVQGAAAGLFSDLEALADRLPATECSRRTECCALLPQMTLLEAARIWDALDRQPAVDAGRIASRLAAYFLINAARIPGCPFLDDSTCSIYGLRPFGCRAYGLYSAKAYRRRTRDSARNAAAVAKAWAGLGIQLPAEVTEHQPSYCRRVRVQDGSTVNDDTLAEIEAAIVEKNRSLGEAAQVFDQTYGSDLSHLVAAEAFGGREALRHKVLVVREHLTGGASPTLGHLADRAAAHFTRPDMEKT